MDDIIFINPPYYIKAEKKLNLAFYRELDIIQPLGLCYLASSCQKKGLKTKIIDMEAEAINLKKLIFKLKKLQPRTIGVTCPSPLLKNVLTLSNEINKELHIPIIIGGPHTMINPETLINDQNIDYVIKGEAEDTLPELIKAINSKKNLEEIPNLIFKKENKIISTPIKDQEKDINEYPFPARELLNNKYYFSIFTKGNVCTGIITSRGCPYNCIFCNPLYKKIRKRSIENVIQEIKEVIQKHNILYFEFFDETFNLNKKWLIDFCQKIIDEKINMRWRIRCRPDLIDDEISSILKKANCITISLGIESANENTLKFFKKNYTLTDIKKAIKSIKEHKLKIHGYFILGSPTETKEEMLNTIDFAIKSKIDYASFTLLTPIPGTELYKIAIEKGWYKDQNKTDYSEQSGYIKAVLKHPTLSQKEIEDIYALAYKKFYLRGNGIKGLIMLTSPKLIMKAISRIC